MIPYFPFFRHPMYYDRYYNYQRNSNNIPNHSVSNNEDYDNKNRVISQPNETVIIESSKDSSEPCLDIFGIHLYFDDILIICLLFFLYQENVNDQLLFVALLLLLLS